MTLSPQTIRSQKDNIKWTSHRNSKRTLSLIKCTQYVSIFILQWHPYTSPSESQWQSILLFFLSFSSYPTKNTLSLTLRTGLRASSKGLFHLLLKYWSAWSTHTHTFIRRHTVRLTPDQSHWQSKPHFIQRERKYT